MMRAKTALLAPDTGAEAAGEELFTRTQVEAMLAQAAEQARLDKERAVNEVREEAARAAAEQTAEQEQDARETALAAREKALERRELRAKALEMLAAQELPAELAEALDYTDAQTMEASLEAVRAVWEKAVQRGVEARMRGAAPRTGGTAVRPGTLREAIEGRYAGA